MGGTEFLKSFLTQMQVAHAHSQHRFWIVIAQNIGQALIAAGHNAASPEEHDPDL